MDRDISLSTKTPGGCTDKTLIILININMYEWIGIYVYH